MPLVDTNLIFSFSTPFLSRSLRSLVRYRVEHLKIKFVSTRGHVILYLLHIMCGYQCDKAVTKNDTREVI